MMKILIASDTYIYQTSGASNVVKELANGLRGAGHDVRVLAPSDRVRSFRHGDDYFIRSVPSFYYPDLRISLTRRSPFFDDLVRWKPDLIHIHTEGALYRMARRIAAKTGAPMIMTAHTDYEHWIFRSLRNTFPVRMIMRTYGRSVYRNVDAVISPSEKGRTLSQLQPAGDRLRVIPNGIRPERVQREIDPQKRKDLLRYWDLEDNGCILITLTRISREKNIEELLRYFPALLERMPQARLLIVGDGPDRKRLEFISRKLQLTDCIRFTGRVEPEEVGNYYGLSNIFLCSSTFEMHSISCLEAMTCGLPVVCREDPWIRGVLEEGRNGYSYSTEQEFVRSVVRILTDGELQNRMREGSVQQAEKFTLQHFLEQTMNLYEEVLAGNTRSGIKML